MNRDNKIRNKKREYFQMTEKKYDIGLMGLAVMGQNLVLNMVDHGFDVAVFNRTTSKVDEFLATEEAQSKGDHLTGAHSLENRNSRME